ncbi:hypothetical protein NKH16_32835 [Mesorhizobium sp. M1307]|uniref:hypothetical protein n=1 Tax=Mesorhizobium sp. M1307 TaxID=2957079 RepID=UPI00333A7D6F
MGFFQKKMEAFLLDSARAHFDKNGIKLIQFDEANDIRVDELFSSYPLGEGYLCLPKADWVNTPIPYDPLFHDENFMNGDSLESIVERHVLSTFSNRKFIMSGRPDVFLAIEFGEFKYDILREIQSGHMTTPLILFDDKKNKGIFFEYDLEINTYSRESSLKEEVLGGIPDDIWIRYFNDNFLSGISYNKHHLDVINNYYRPVIPGLKKFQ